MIPVEAVRFHAWRAVLPGSPLGKPSVLNTAGSSLLSNFHHLESKLLHCVWHFPLIISFQLPCLDHLTLLLSVSFMFFTENSAPWGQHCGADRLKPLSAMHDIPCECRFLAAAPQISKLLMPLVRQWKVAQVPVTLLLTCKTWMELQPPDFRLVQPCLPWPFGE